MFVDIGLESAQKPMLHVGVAGLSWRHDNMLSLQKFMLHAVILVFLELLES
jgi:hypothetical protein